MKILIVEDDFASRLLIQDLLRGFGEIHTVVNGNEAVEAVRHAIEGAEPYDLICLDIMMPGKDGQQALREIRALEAEKGFVNDGSKIIMMTALSDLKSVSTAYSGLCDAYLTKPLAREKLMETLNRLALAG
jgi:two-component system, chemotaxis family, chemotaxis protein CheY